MNCQVTIPTSRETPSGGNSWGFITVVHGEGGIDYHSKYWFDTATAMLFFLCLGTSEYAPDNRSMEQLLLPTIEEVRLDLGNIAKTIEALEHAFGDELKIVWFGQFSDLLEGKSNFAERLRNAFCSPCDSEQITCSNADAFSEWLLEFDGFVSTPV